MLRFKCRLGKTLITVGVTVDYLTRTMVKECCNRVSTVKYTCNINLKQTPYIVTSVQIARLKFVGSQPPFLPYQIDYVITTKEMKPDESSVLLSIVLNDTE